MKKSCSNAAFLMLPKRICSSQWGFRNPLKISSRQGPSSPGLGPTALKALGLPHVRSEGQGTV